LFQFGVGNNRFFFCGKIDIKFHSSPLGGSDVFDIFLLTILTNSLAKKLSSFHTFGSFDKQETFFFSHFHVIFQQKINQDDDAGEKRLEYYFCSMNEDAN